MTNLDELRRELERIERQLNATAPATSGDPALARLGGPALRRHHKRTDARLARYARLLAMRDALRMRITVEESRRAEASRKRLTADDIQGATRVRDRFGWHEVVRVNKTSVTVATGYSWTDRIAIDRIIEAAS